MTLFLLIVFGIYFLLLLALLIGSNISINKRTTSTVKIHHSITVIVPFRNEALYLSQLADDLRAQNYPSELITILFIDDHSTDNSADVLKKKLSSISNFNIISLPDGTTSKKQAIHYGIQHAEGKLIVTTDADCRLQSTWLKAINAAFQNEKLKFVFGAVKIENNFTFFSKLQAIEFSSLIGSGAATSKLGFPTMCNGANLAYYKETYVELNGYEDNFEIASGDDEFLMRKIAERYPNSISFLDESAAVVTTEPQHTVKDFVNQRLRWAGKWKHNQSVITKLLAVFVLVFQITFLAAICLIVTQKASSLVLVCVGIKIVLEFVFLMQVGIFTRQKLNPAYFLVLQFIYPVYVIVIGILSQVKSYSWKGRILNKG